MEEKETNVQDIAQEPKETDAVPAAASEADAASQELTIPENWESPIKEFFNSDVFKGNQEARKIFFDKFKSLDDGFQKKFNDFSKKEKEFASQYENFKKDERFLNSYRDFENQLAQEDRSKILSQFGGIPQYMARLYNLDKQFSNNPLEFIQGIMKAGGITLEMLQNGVNSPAYQQRQFQNAQAQKIGEMEQRLQQLVEQRFNQQTFANKVLAFAQEKDENGNNAHPYLEQVANMMDLLMGQNPNLTLQDAYDNACYSVPEIRTQILKANLEKEAKAQAQAAEVAKAKNAKGISSAPVAGSHKKKDWQTVLEEGIEAQGGE